MLLSSAEFSVRSDPEPQRTTLIFDIYRNDNPATGVCIAEIRRIVQESLLGCTFLACLMALAGRQDAPEHKILVKLSYIVDSLLLHAHGQDGEKCDKKSRGKKNEPPYTGRKGAVR